MSIQKIVLGLAIVAGFTACTQTTTTIQVPPGLSASQAFDSIVFPRAIATVVSNGCTRRGVTLKERSWRAGVRRDINGLVANGYSPLELERLITPASEQALIKRGIRYLEQRGVKRGQVETLCTFGREEVAKGSTIGKLLKET